MYDPLKSLLERLEVRIPLIYLVISFLWILFSDLALSVLVSDPDLRTRIQTYKGWGFVFFTAVLIFTLLHRQLKKRRRIEEQFHTILQTAVDGIITFDEPGRIRSLNPAAGRIFGYATTEATALNIGALLPFLPELPTQIPGASFETKAVRKNGTEFPADCSINRIEMGATVLYAVFVRDLTEKKTLEQRFLRAQRLENVGTLAAGVAHDLNNILAPIMMTAGLMRAKDREGRQKHQLDTIERSARQAANILKQLLTFGRGVEGKRVELQLRHAACEVASLAQRTFPDSIAVRTHLPDDLCPLVGDATQIQQVLLNLCINARDAMPKGGTLTLSAENRYIEFPDTELNPQAEPGSYIVIHITDTGTGIPKEDIDKIFDPFFTTKETRKGTGLGLSTALGIVKSHGGFMTVRSEPGKGTEFTVCLPTSAASTE